MRGTGYADVSFILQVPGNKPNGGFGDVLYIYSLQVVVIVL